MALESGAGGVVEGLDLLRRRRGRSRRHLLGQRRQTLSLTWLDWGKVVLVRVDGG